MEVKTSAKLNQTASFCIVAGVYAFSAAAGIIIYRELPFSWWLNLLIADIAATVVTFIFSLIFKNASVYDPYWSVQPIVILTGFAASVEMTASRLLLLAVVYLWGLRLTANWAYTFHGLSHQDWRYTMLKEQTKRFYPLVNFFGIHLVPTLIVYACTLPGVYAFWNDVAFNVFSVLFCLLSMLAVLLQGTADYQMHRFRKATSRGFIRNGLWKYSRHPNYLGEILMWWGVALSVTAAVPHAWYLCAGAVLNTLLFLGISIPMADKHQSRKPGFEAYRKETRMLLPIKK